jgi:hypothetical protein
MQFADLRGGEIRVSTCRFFSDKPYSIYRQGNLLFDFRKNIYLYISSVNPSVPTYPNTRLGGNFLNNILFLYNMTAVVGILNKQAVAIAADSAVTISGANGRKIFNKANKVFTLSKYHPVAVMIYNSASFMDTPWETIIKMYRRQLAERNFPTVAEYQNDFISYLKARHFFTTPEVQTVYLQNFSLWLINELNRELANSHRHLIEAPNEENRREFMRLLESKVDELRGRFPDGQNCCPEFVDYTFEEFDRYASPTLTAIIQEKFTQNGLEVSHELRIKLASLIFSVLRVKGEHANYTGLIFTGFGEDEIYPQLIPVNISMVVDNRLRYYVAEDKAAYISDRNSGAVCPFAQTDVINTILSGIDPALEEIFLNNFGALFEKYNDLILNEIGGSNQELAVQIQSLDTQAVVAEYIRMNQRIKRENYIQPLMNAVSSLSKEDLAEMAESLIYLTYLKRRITFAEESVGGPVDVAVISKGDGFIWIKRKHYFQPELNQFFFNNYFKV